MICCDVPKTKRFANGGSELTHTSIHLDNKLVAGGGEAFLKRSAAQID